MLSLLATKDEYIKQVERLLHVSLLIVFADALTVARAQCSLA